MNYIETKKTLTRYINARIPFIAINTIEKTRTLNLLKEISTEKNYNINLFSMSKGFSDLNTGEVFSNDKLFISSLDYISNELSTSENKIYVLSDTEDLSTESITSRYLSDLTTLAEKKSSVIMVITSSPIWTHLQRQGMSIDLDLPDINEIYNIIIKTIEPYQNSINLEWNKDDAKEAASVLIGLSTTEIKNVISSLIAKGSLTKKDITDLKYAKDSLFSNINGLEKIIVDENLSFGGLDNLKSWLNEKGKLLTLNKKDEMKKRGMRPPKGILLLGVPGCGKSLAAKAISLRWKRPLYRLDFSTIQGMYVGQSEQQLKEALETAEHVSPCILWIDEIEKGLAGVHDSNGVTQRLIGQFLFWLQESRKDVFVVATANDIQALPTELLRKGRFDELFFIDLPNKIERKEIINLYIKKYFGFDVTNELLDRLTTMSETYSSSDIESVLRDLAYKCIAENEQVYDEDFIDAFNNAISMYKTNKERIDQIRSWAKNRTKRASTQIDTPEVKVIE